MNVIDSKSISKLYNLEINTHKAKNDFHCLFKGLTRINKLWNKTLLRKIIFMTCFKLFSAFPKIYSDEHFKHLSVWFLLRSFNAPAYPSINRLWKSNNLSKIIIMTISSFKTLAAFLKSPPRNISSIFPYNSYCVL